MKREFGLVQKSLDEARLRLTYLKCLQGKLDEYNVKAVRLETEVGELRLKVAEAKKIGVAKFKEFDAINLY